MKVGSIDVQGFGSFKERTIFEFEPNTVYRVTGNNGAGKSTFFIESFSYLFFGKPYKDMKVSDFINDNSRQCGVTLNDLDENSYTRIRGNKSTEKDILINENSVSQEKLSNVVNMDHSLFFNSVVFGQGFGGFVYFKDKAKKEFVTKLSLKFIDEIIMKLNKQLGTIEEDLNEFGIDIETIEENILNLEIESLNKQYKKAEKEKQQDVKGNKREIKELERKLISLEEKLVKKREKAEAHLVKEKKYAREIDSTEKVWEVAKDRLEEANNKLKIANEKFRDIKRSIKDIKEHTGDCPYCYRDINKKDKKIILQELGADKYSLENKVLKFKKRVEILNEVENKARHKKNMAVDKYNNAVECVIQCQGEEADVRRGIKVVKNEIKSIEKFINKVNKERNPYKQIIKEAKYKEEKYLEKIKKKKAKRKYSKIKLKAISDWIKKLKAFRSSTFNDILDSLQPLSNRYLAYISNGRFKIEIVTEAKQTKKRVTDKFDLKIIDRGKRVNFERLSGGEKRQVSLAINMAFIQLIHFHLANDWNIIIFDEIFDNLDEFVKEKVVGLLDKLREETKKIIVMITHDKVESVDYDRFVDVKVVNKRGSSKLIMEGR